MLRRAGGVDPRQDGDDRVRAPADRQDAQSAQSRAHAGRLVLRLGRRGRGRHGADRDRLADRGLGDPARRLSAASRRSSRPTS